MPSLLSRTVLGHPVEIREATCDEGIIQEIMGLDCYRLNALVPLPEHVFVDIGAHIGIFCVRAARQFPSHRVLGYEMDGENFGLLRRNTEKLPNVSVLRRAVVGAKTPCGYRRNPINSGGHHIQWVSDESAYPLPPLITLNEILSQAGGRVVLKMDCEGAEHEILEAADMASVDIVTMEYHNFFHRDVSARLARMLSEDFVVEVRPTNDMCGALYAVRRA